VNDCPPLELAPPELELPAFELFDDDPDDDAEDFLNKLQPVNTREVPRIRAVNECRRTWVWVFDIIASLKTAPGIFRGPY
jgi:hypothetical protein